MTLVHHGVAKIVLTINHLLINDQKKFIVPWNNNNVGLLITLTYLMYDLRLLVNNPHFSSMDHTAVHIQGGCSSKTKQIFITNCTFTLIRYHDIIHINLKPVNMISCKNTFGIKKVQPSKVESYLEVNI